MTNLAKKARDKRMKERTLLSNERSERLILILEVVEIDFVRTVPIDDQVHGLSLTVEKTGIAADYFEANDILVDVFPIENTFLLLLGGVISGHHGQFTGVVAFYFEGNDLIVDIEIPFPGSDEGRSVAAFSSVVTVVLSTS